MNSLLEKASLLGDRRPLKFTTLRQGAAALASNRWSDLGAIVHVQEKVKAEAPWRTAMDLNLAAALLQEEAIGCAF